MLFEQLTINCLDVESRFLPNLTWQLATLECAKCTCSGQPEITGTSLQRNESASALSNSSTAFQVRASPVPLALQNAPVLLDRSRVHSLALLMDQWRFNAARCL